MFRSTRTVLNASSLSVKFSSENILIICIIIIEVYKCKPMHTIPLHQDQLRIITRVATA